MFVKNSTGVLKKVLLSRPSYLKPAPINEIAKKWENTVLDVPTMEREHRQLVQAYRDNGVEVSFLEPDEKRPSAVFARDFGGCVREGVILGRFKLELRKWEHIDYAERLKQMGIPVVAEVREGVFEGGDFWMLDDRTIAIGMADRSDRKGVEEIRSQMRPYGYTVLGVPLKPAYLHMDMCFNLVAEHLAVACPEALPEEFRRELKMRDVRVIPVPEEAIFLHGCNLQSFGGNRVLSLKQNTQVNEELDKNHMKVIELEITEILKAGGGPHCMTFPLERI